MIKRFFLVAIIVSFAVPSVSKELKVFGNWGHVINKKRLPMKQKFILLPRQLKLIVNMNLQNLFLVLIVIDYILVD